MTLHDHPGDVKQAAVNGVRPGVPQPAYPPPLFDDPPIPAVALPPTAAATRLASCWLIGYNAGNAGNEGRYPYPNMSLAEKHAYDEAFIRGRREWAEAA